MKKMIGLKVNNEIIDKRKRYLKYGMRNISALIDQPHATFY